MNDLVAPVVILVIAGLMLLVYRKIDERHEAEDYFYNQNRTIYYLMYACNIILVMAFALNSKYMVAQLAKMLLSATPLRKFVIGR